MTTSRVDFSACPLAACYRVGHIQNLFASQFRASHFLIKMPAHDFFNIAISVVFLCPWNEASEAWAPYVIACEEDLAMTYAFRGRTYFDTNHLGCRQHQHLESGFRDITSPHVLVLEYNGYQAKGLRNSREHNPPVRLSVY